MIKENLLFVEKYRPQVIDDCVLPKRLSSIFQAQVDKGDLQNALYVGPAGTGKTTVAKALCNELDIDSLFINASEYGNIDMLRTTVRSFASTISFNKGKTKCIILDEADYLNPNSTQPALRSFIEEFSGNARFILTANYAHRILDPIKSRCPVVDFTLSKEEKQDVILRFNHRIKNILEIEGIEFNKKDVAEIIIKYFPDYRRILNEIQKHSYDGKLNLSFISSDAIENIKELIKALKAKRFGDMRKWVVENNDVDFSQLIRVLYEKMFELVEADSIPELVLIVNEFDYKRAFVLDHEINTVAMLVQIMGNVVFK